MKNAEENSAVHDWPRRWHQIVAEYNVSFERQQNQMRSHFEERFDQIRKENDDDVQTIRVERDCCARRVCDLIDLQADSAEANSKLSEELIDIQKEEAIVDERLKAINHMSHHLCNQISRLQETFRQRERDLQSSIIQLDAKKSALREEINDLRGFLCMNKRLSDLQSADGGTILATARRRNR
jgi:hypothetical protein